MRAPERLGVEGVLSAEQVIDTAASIRSDQTDEGLILWFPDGHSDPWNHIEAAMALDLAGFEAEALAAYDWLRRHQHPDGWWHHYYLADGIEDPKIDSNVCAYVATGIWHHYLLSGDRRFLADHRLMVERAIDMVLGMQKPGGEIIWARHQHESPWDYALLTGSSSILHSLRCAVAIVAELGEDRPDWELAAARLADAITHRPEAFAPKVRWAMDWYYPVLAGPLGPGPGDARLDADRSRFVIEGRGVRCVSDQPWVTAAETSEAVMAYAQIGRIGEAVELFSWLTPTRCDDGAYLTGMVWPDGISYPDGERSTYTAAAVVLAADALSRASSASGLFVDDRTLPMVFELGNDPASRPEG